MKNLPLIPALLLAITASAFAADAPARTEAEILKSVKLPDGYEATVFAMPPNEARFRWLPTHAPAGSIGRATDKEAKPPKIESLREAPTIIACGRAMNG